MGAKLPRPAPNRDPSSRVDPGYAKPPASPAPSPRIRHGHGPDRAALAARIRAERMRLGLSQSEAARRLDVHRDTYRQWEEGRDLPLSSLCALVALGMRLGRIAPELDALAGKNQ